MNIARFKVRNFVLLALEIQLLGIFLLTSAFADSGRLRVGLLLDDPCGEVPGLETSFALETAQRLSELEIVPIFPAERGGDAETTTPGSVCTSDGKPVNLEDFSVIWVHQGDEAPAEGPLFSEAWGKTLRVWLNAKPNEPRTLLLTGGAPRLLNVCGAAVVESAPVPIMNDRFQVGLVPEGGIENSSSLWKNLQSDRGVFWFTNAVYASFQHCSVKLPDGNEPAAELKTAAAVPGGASNPFYALRRGNTVIFVLCWNFSQMYDRAAPEFRNNTETFLKNILEWKFNDENWAILNVPLPPKTVFPVEPLRKMMEAYKAKHGTEYPNQTDFLNRLQKFSDALPLPPSDPKSAAALADFEALKREILLAHPDLNFDRILYIERKGTDPALPQNYNSNCVLPKSGYKNTLGILNFRTGTRQTIYTPPNDFWVGDLELHFEADKVLFSMPDAAMEDPRWRLWELPIPDEKATENTSGNAAENAVSTLPEAVKVPTIEEADVDNYDACYLADDGLVFCSTACFTGVPCINGSGHVCNLYRKSSEGDISQLTVEQDHDWNPVLLPNGRVLYLRWEYSDLPHGFSRILMHTNPDGTNQTEYYGSGSYYPNTMFYARPIPGSGSCFSAIVSGHHELPRVGDLVIFDPSKGRKEAAGAVQRIPGAGKPVSPVVLDFPIAQTWPKFTQPIPISDTLFLTACRPNEQSPWGIWLVDVYDNQLELARAETRADGTVFSLLEPTPIRKTERPRVIPDRKVAERTDADVFIADVYYGQGLPGVPRGTVKQLRVFTYEFAYQGMGAEPYSVGLDGPWDPKRVLGTVPVYEDGSASFRIPANTPVAFQALDSEGRAVQLMRSWTTAMPGEAVSCTGCHEEQNSVPPTMQTPIASRTPPVEITPYVGTPNGTRGFSFQHEIQPILESHCVACHDGTGSSRETAGETLLERLMKNAQTNRENQKTDVQKSFVSFLNGPVVPTFESASSYNTSSRFSPSYYNLRRYVRTPTKESQMAVLKPYEFSAESTFLVQILQAGHFGVQLAPEEWERLYTWIDLNAPYYGSWGESRNYAIAPLVKHQYERRQALRKLYASTSEPGADNPDDFPVPTDAAGEKPAEIRRPHQDFVVERTASAASGASPISVEAVRRTELAPGVTLELVPVPGKSWFIGRFEITNEQYRLFDASHDSGIEYGDFIHFSPNEQGWLLSRAQQPVVRLRADEAEAFCAWLSAKTGWKFTLPTAEEWRFAAMGGKTYTNEKPSDAWFWFGGETADYSRCENLSDVSNQRINPRSWSGRPEALPPWRIADTNIDDRCRVSASVGSYWPNPIGMYDVHGNVSEWTSTLAPDGSRLALGGSWYTPARFAGIWNERHFSHGQEVFDVGFRVKCELEPEPKP